MMLIIIYHFIFSFIASISFGMLCRVPKETVITGGVVGASGWLGFFLLNEAGYGIFITSFCCSLILSILSYIYSYWKKYPSIVFFIPGLVPVVPGITFYEVFKALFMGNSATASARFFDVIASAVALACGITIGNIIFLMAKNLISSRKTKRKLKLK
ncbi:threonine/serine exporter family protein [Listeria sp. PSOL-1]|uniref:threonine/serine exporter family protein n=1 Tax=Listeria sp. PSOL-1 TaxID=1844999 RepID=UPI0013D48A79|nr:threonine/serine exporter family protein [Listeria sp. PSOL-1]